LISNDTEKKPANPQKQGLAIWRAIAFLLAGVCGYLLYYISQLKTDVQEQVVVVEARSAALTQATTSLDSLSSELNLRMAEIRRLGADTASLSLLRTSLMADLAQARRTSSRDARSIATLREKVNAYVMLLNDKDEEITKIRSHRDRLFADNRRLKTNIVEQSDSLRQQVQKGAELTQKVALASVLKMEGLHISFLDSRGTERDEEVIRSKRLEQLKITGQISDNKVAPMGTRDLYLRLLDPNGQTMPDPSGSSSSLLLPDGREIAYSLRQSFIFDNQMPRITFLYNRGAPYPEGPYTVEIYCEGSLMSTGRFIVR
jgi:hypothetical protein